MGLLGMSDEQTERALTATQQDLECTNAENELYLFELQIAELRRWKELKCIDLLARIDAIFLDEYHRIKNQ